MNPKIKTGLLFGSFNPIHCGHLMVAGYMAEYTDLRQIWFVVSPHNPLKEKSTLLSGHHRLAMVNMAIDGDPRFRSSDVEFCLPQPSYTIDTLICLQKKYPDHEFVLVAGADILPEFEKWKSWETLLEKYQIYLYPRTDTGGSQFDNHPSIRWVKAPLVTVSSSFIRRGIRQGKEMRYFLPEKVWRYIVKMGFYGTRSSE